MCESESGFGFESGFKAFLAGFGFGFRPQKGESGFGFKKKWVDSDSEILVHIQSIFSYSVVRTLINAWYMVKPQHLFEIFAQL